MKAIPKIKVYLAGKVSGLEYSETFEKFEYWQSMLEYLGYEVVNPMKLVPEVTDWETAMYMCLIELKKCDKIFLIPDFLKSPGALVELNKAYEWKIPVLSKGFIYAAYLDKVRKTSTIQY